MREKRANTIAVHKCVSTASKQMCTPTKTQSTNSMLHKNGNLQIKLHIQAANMRTVDVPDDISRNFILCSSMKSQNVKNITTQ